MSKAALPVLRALTRDWIQRTPACSCGTCRRAAAINELEPGARPHH